MTLLPSVDLYRPDLGDDFVILSCLERLRYGDRSQFGRQ